MTPGFNVSASTSSSLTQVSHTHSLALAFERWLVGIVERQVRKWICPSSSLLPLGIESHLKSCLEKLTHQKFLLPTENWDTLENSQDPLLGRDTSSSQMKSQFLYLTPLLFFFLDSTVDLPLKNLGVVISLPWGALTISIASPCPTFSLSLTRNCRRSTRSCPESWTHWTDSRSRTPSIAKEFVFVGWIFYQPSNLLGIQEEFALKLSP